MKVFNQGTIYDWSTADIPEKEVSILDIVSPV